MARLAKQKITPILFVLWVPVLCMILCAFHGHNLLDIYLPAGWCSDEVSYYKQIEAMIRYFTPQGYWGYNESQALIGTFGPWLPISFFPYVLIGKLIGWTYSTPVICNQLFICISMYLYWRIRKPSIENMIWIMVIESTTIWLIRYSISGMLESYVIALSIVLITLLTSQVKHKNIWIYIVVILLFLVRPYYVLLIFLPCITATPDNKKKYILTSGLSTITLVVMYFVSRWLFCAAYISSDMVSLSSITSFIKSCIEKLLKVVELIRTGGATYGYGYSFMCMILLLCILYCFFDYRKNKVLSDENKILLYILFFIVGTFGSIIIMYDPYAGSRHIFEAAYLGLFAILCMKGYTNKYKVVTLIISMILTVTYISNSVYLLSVPFYDESEGKIPVGMSMGELYHRNEKGWDNTLAVNVSEVDYNYVYYLPSYLGIQIVWEDFLLDNENIQSAYILTSSSGKVSDHLQDMGYKIIFEDTDKNLAILSRL